MTAQAVLRVVGKEDSEKKRALEAALSQIDRAFGKGSVMKLGARDRAVETEAVSTGSLGLDIALGIGGLPRGRVIEVYGPESSGKTTLALHAVAEIQKKGGVAAYVDAEHALDPGYAWAHHVLGRWHREMVELGRIARLWVSLFYGGLPPGSLETALEHLDRAVALEPDEMAHHVERGLILVDLKRSDDARRALEHALALPNTARHHTEFRQRGQEALRKLPSD